jgi:hypothetical protein
MTNARATDGACASAKDHKIIVVYRPVLQQWMSQVRTQTEQRGRAPGTPGSALPRRMRPAAKVTAGTLGAGFILLIVIAIQLPAPRGPARATTSRPQPAVSAVSGPRAVVMEAFTAIDRHNWRTLCKLWSHQDSGHRCGYRKMIAGYRLTDKDVVTSLRANGDVVSARVLAYETTGTVQTFEFSYNVHAGKIIWGHSVLLAISTGRTAPWTVPGR